MGEVIIYRLSNMFNYILFCLVCIILIGFFFFYLTKEEKYVVKQAKIYGLFINLRQIDIFMLSINILKLITIIYCAFNINQDIWTYITIIIILGATFTLFNFRKIIFEIINTIAPCFMLYLISILYNFQQEVDENIYVSVISITLTTLVCLYSIYAFLNSIDDIAKKNKNIRRNANEKK